MEDTLRTAAVVHLDKLAANVKKVQDRLAPGVALTAVLKADAYGMGAAGVYPTLRACGIKRFAVAYWQEGAALRDAGAADESIQLLTPIRDGELERAVQYRLTPSLFLREQAELLDGLAARAGVIQPVQIKIDTGMNRIGLPWGQAAVEPVKAMARLAHLRIEGVYTHFFKADDPVDPVTEVQLDRLRQTLELLREAGVEIPAAHAANSAALILQPETQLDGVRVGDALYGLITVDDEPWDRLGLEEILTWESYIAYVKTVPAGEPVGYGGTYVTRRETRIATVPVGYADGYSRNLSNRGSVVIRGREAPVIGRVCMDQFMVDVTDVPGAARNDAVSLLGGGMTLRRMSALSGVSVDELVCGITKRVPRIYVRK